MENQAVNHTGPQEVIATHPEKGETDVLVVGAGPMGPTLACELKQRGIDVRLIE
jgi:NADPH-dependent 2,4-dienoyl-CoA reductase/sulfur reductase-like enzyme